MVEGDPMEGGVRGESERRAVYFYRRGIREDGKKRQETRKEGPKVVGMRK
jgi:hypothetical protein